VSLTPRISAAVLLALVIPFTGGCGAESGAGAPLATASDVPAFRVDPFWATDLGNDWIVGEVSGITVDDRDHIWIMHRPSTLDARQRGEEGMCCVPAPPVIELDPEGNVVQGWGGSDGPGYRWFLREHGIRLDHEGAVWLTGDDQVLKFTRDGEFLLKIGERDTTGGSNDTRLLGGPADTWVDAETNELYVADGYGNRRVIVFDATTGEYRRHWGAYGERPDDADLGPYDPDEPPARQFGSPVHAVAISNDGLVYVADRANNRLQVFQKSGEFIREAFVRRETLGAGAVAGITFSRDPEQRWIFIPDSTNNVVWIMNRTTLEVADTFGRLGKYAGQFYRLHQVDLDSRGNLYTGEVNAGQRFQKFEPVGP